MSRGKYIVIEGNDGTGKSTQAELLATWLKEEKSIETFVTHEPDGPGISAQIRKVIKDGTFERSGHTNLLLFTASRHEIWKRASQELELGRWVLSARNYISTMVYQGYGEGVDTELIRNTTETFTDERYMNPDITIVLGVSDDERKRRIQSRGEVSTVDTFESRDEQFQEKLNSGYEEIAKQYDYPFIDASKTIEEIQVEIQTLLTAAFDTSSE